MILGRWPTWRTILYYVFIFIFIFNYLHVSSTSCSSSGETNCINTTSGNYRSVSVAVSCAGRKFTSTMYLFLLLFLTLYMFRAHRAHHQERQIVSSQPLVTVTLFTVGGRVVCRSEVNFRTARDTTTDSKQNDSHQRLYWHNLSLLMMSTMCSKHVES
jgi:hypothetical protein